MTDPKDRAPFPGGVDNTPGGRALGLDKLDTETDEPQHQWTVEHNTVFNEAEDAEIQVYRSGDTAALAQRVAAALNDRPAPAQTAELPTAEQFHEWTGRPITMCTRILHDISTWQRDHEALAGRTDPENDRG